MLNEEVINIDDVLTDSTKQLEKQMVADKAAKAARRYSAKEFDKLFTHTMQKLGLETSKSDRGILDIKNQVVKDSDMLDADVHGRKITFSDEADDRRMTEHGYTANAVVAVDHSDVMAQVGQ